jgi:hypothetical protein
MMSAKRWEKSHQLSLAVWWCRHIDDAKKPTHTAHSFGDLLTGSDASSTDTICVLLEQLSESAINSDWGQWLTKMQTLESDWFAPVLAIKKPPARQRHAVLL